MKTRSLQGRRVKIVLQEDASASAIGKTGKVVSEYKSEDDSKVLYYLLQLDGWKDGHRGDDESDNAPFDKWYFNREAFKLLSRRKKKVAR